MVTTLVNRIFLYEHAAGDLASRLWKHFGYAALLVGVSLLVGTLGFHFAAPQNWDDAFLDASMLLGGMGPIGNPEGWHRGGKMFGAFFSLYSGLVFLAVAGLLFTPVLHELMHKLHDHLAQTLGKRRELAST